MDASSLSLQQALGKFPIFDQEGLWIPGRYCNLGKTLVLTSYWKVSARLDCGDMYTFHSLTA